jgi:EmrB/QacA subfamily drug resistance transporter
MQRTLLVVALMFSIAMAAMDATVVSTALPTIVGQLGGLSLFSWVFSVYLLTSTVTVPLYGKLADLYGRKPVLLFGASLFLVGSALCGAAGSMEELILFRAVQGIGAGAVQPITMTIIGDIFTIEQRAKIQGLFSSVWGVTSLAGPALGGLITQGLSWRWVFFINIPIGLIAIALIWVFFRENMADRKQAHSLDYYGTILLSGAVVALLLGLLHGVERYGWTGTETLVFWGTAAVLFGVFLWQERRALEPVLPLWLFKNKVIVVGCLGTFVGGGLMFGVSSYVPLFAQGVFGGDALDAGLIVLPMSFSWPVASVIGGRVILRFGYHTAMMIGGVFLILGAATLLPLDRDSSLAIPLTAALLVGFGMGFMTSALVISVQNAVEWRYRGVATASIQFMRTIGGSISVAIMGAILNSQLSGRFAEVQGVPAGANEATLLNVEERSALAPEVLDAMQRALAASLHDIFLFVLGIAVIAFAVVLFFPRGRAHELQHGAAPPSTGAGTGTTARRSIEGSPLPEES